MHAAIDRCSLRHDRTPQCRRCVHCFVFVFRSIIIVVWRVRDRRRKTIIIIIVSRRARPCTFSVRRHRSRAVLVVISREFFFSTLCTLYLRRETRIRRNPAAASREHGPAYYYNPAQGTSGPRRGNVHVCTV